MKFSEGKKRTPETARPYYLQEPYLQEIFGNTKSLALNDFLCLNTIENPKILSRALTLECLIQNRFS